ncbi:hypothetical protein BDA96_06G261600 [Sorghum bicolor]|uniref:Uncharacterized protein n=1 Tax=Sorghum bicolor TaxID=4558 RepID=A0A921QU81_SORBI|nr:hypothetical protein BDA96_06G261600 [Sorghum bicolor]
MSLENSGPHVKTSTGGRHTHGEGPEANHTGERRHSKLAQDFQNKSNPTIGCC